MLRELLDDTFALLDAAIEGHEPSLRSREIGIVTHAGGHIARVRGLPTISADELVRFADGTLGIAINLEADEVGIVMLGASKAVTAGSEVEATGRQADTLVGNALLGRVVDATGQVLDGGPPLQIHERRPIERPAPPIMDRAPVSVPLHTGIKAIDALIPIGRGQRELIVGDRQSGKSAIAVATIINQRHTDVISIYCAIGQRGTSVARVVETLKEHDALKHTIVLVASGDAPPGLQYITPYVATTLGEYFMQQGHDVLVVFDDLTRHARAYRELSLLLRRPPGREAYPGDIFYIHSRLLERATHLREDRGGGSLTALPIIETQGEDISAYIPTNLISITDGQIYVSPTLFRKGLMPAIDIGKSVSRVGGKTQLPAYREVAGKLRLAYSQFEELETFARFGTRLDEETRATIERGRRVREVLKQGEHEVLGVCEQIAVLFSVNNGLFDSVTMEKMAEAERALRQRVCSELARICEKMQDGETLSDDDWQALRQVAGEAVEPFCEDKQREKGHAEH